MTDVTNLTPLKQYSDFYKESYKKNSEKYFKDLVEKSYIDVDLNQKLVKEVELLKSDKAQTDKEEKKLRNWRIFLRVVAVISIFLAINGTLKLAQGLPSTTSIVFVSVGYPIFLFAVLFSKLYLAKRIAIYDSKGKDLYKQLVEKMTDAFNTTAGLRELIDPTAFFQLFTKTIPYIKFDDEFNIKRLDYLINKFGFNAEVDYNNNNLSTVSLKSGSMDGNPFLFAKTISHEVIQKQYNGELLITWTETYYSDGKMQTRTRSEVLHASVYKPAPEYNEDVSLFYANEAAPNLSFSREMRGTALMSEKKMDKFVKKEEKKMKKRAEKAVRKSGDYTLMSDSEFEALFGAVDRDHEVEFRLLFTPLAMRGMVELLKDKEVGYGDTFYFNKRKMINAIRPLQLKSPYDIDNLNELKHKYMWENECPYYLIKGPFDQEAVKRDLLGYTLNDIEDKYVDLHVNKNYGSYLNLKHSNLIEWENVNCGGIKEIFGDSIREKFADTEFDLSDPEIFSYDYKAIAKQFAHISNDYFKRLFFTFAPILCIPIYMQTKPHEYIYKDVYDSNLSFYEHEKAVNTLGENKFRHPKSITPNILKTRTLRKTKNSDIIEVRAQGYRVKDRVDYVRVFGGDGRYHSVPVPWIQYIPVVNTSKAEVRYFEKEEKEKNIQEQIRDYVTTLRRTQRLVDGKYCSIGDIFIRVFRDEEEM